LPAYGSILASKPDELWGIDTVVEETVPVWLCLIEHAVRFAFGEIRLGIANGLQIRCDNLPAYREASFCSPLAKLGIRTSYIAPLNPRGNGLAERFVRTLKDNRLAIRYFATQQELADEMAAFRLVYNEFYILQRWDYRTPEEVRRLFHESKK